MRTNVVVSAEDSSGAKYHPKSIAHQVIEDGERRSHVLVIYTLVDESGTKEFVVTLECETDPEATSSNQINFRHEVKTEEAGL